MASDEASWRFRRRLFIALAIILLGAIAYCFIASLMNPWSRLYNEEQELDLYSGRARFTRHVLYCQARQDVRETPLSHALNSDDKQTSDEKWVKVNIFGFCTGNSPHFIYHGAFSQIGRLAQYWDTGSFDETARAKTARQLLKVWRKGGSYFVGGEYLRLLQETLGPEPAEGLVTADKIPDDLAERTLAKYAEQSTSGASEH